MSAAVCVSGLQSYISRDSCQVLCWAACFVQKKITGTHQFLVCLCSTSIYINWQLSSRMKFSILLGALHSSMWNQYFHCYTVSRWFTTSFHSSKNSDRLKCFPTQPDINKILMLAGKPSASHQTPSQWLIQHTYWILTEEHVYRNTASD